MNLAERCTQKRAKEEGKSRKVYAVPSNFSLSNDPEKLAETKKIKKTTDESKGESKVE